MVVVLAVVAVTCAPGMADLAVPVTAGSGLHTSPEFPGLNGRGALAEIRGPDPFLAAVSADLPTAPGSHLVESLEGLSRLDALLGAGQLQPVRTGSEAAAPEAGCVVKTLPPAPDAASLVLSGLMTLGAVHLARNARNVHLAQALHSAVVPDWYHTDARTIGSSVPYSLQQPAQPAYVIAALLARLAEHSRGPAEHRSLSALADTTQCIHLTAAPRGPPMA